MSDLAEPVLELRGVGKSFAGVRALTDVSLTVRRGTVVALLGENGAGKSTLINIMSGVFTDYEGAVVIDGEPIALSSPATAQQQGIATIHQELNLIPDLSIADNIWLGREQSSAGVVRRRRTNELSRELLQRVGLDLDPRRLVRQCRLAEQQLIEVAKAISMDARVLIMDEPTSALAESEVRRLFDVVRSLTARGVGIVYVSHRLEELEEIASSVTVLRDGGWIGDRDMEGVSRAELIRMMVGREVHENAHVDGSSLPDAEPRLSVHGLELRADMSVSRAALRGIDFDVRPGEVIGLAGLMGAGRTEALETIFGVYPPADVSGTVNIDGVALRRRSPKVSIRHGIALVAEDRKTQSLVLGGSVKFNTTLVALRRFARFGWVRSRLETASARAQLTDLQTKTPGLGSEVRALSGGNQQKVVLAKWLLTSPQVILLDEPTRGIDIGAKSEIYAIVRALAAQGVSFVVASSELPELLGLCDRILVIRDGRVSADFSAAEATQEGLLAAAMPTDAPREQLENGGDR